MSYTTRRNGNFHDILDGEVVVGRAIRYGNGRYGVSDTNGERLGNGDSYANLSEVKSVFDHISTWRSFGEVARNRLNEQCQYASRMIEGKHGSPRLGGGLRFEHLDSGSYHDILIHRDDIEAFVERVGQHREQAA